MTQPQQGTDDYNQCLARILISDPYSTLTFPGSYTGNVSGAGCVLLQDKDWDTLENLLSKSSNTKRFKFFLYIESQQEEAFTVPVQLSIDDHPKVSTAPLSELESKSKRHKKRPPGSSSPN